MLFGLKGKTLIHYETTNYLENEKILFFPAKLFTQSSKKSRLRHQQYILLFKFFHVRLLLGAQAVTNQLGYGSGCFLRSFAMLY